MTNLSKSIPNGRWLHIIPPCIIIYIVAFMDRTNIGFATAGGMDKALGISATVSGIAAGIFFFGYLFLQIPGGKMAERGYGKNFITISILAWGLIAVLNGFVQNTWQLLLVRFLLGVAEGGVWPCILGILANWFPSKELGRANAYFIMNIAVASIITGPLSGWIISVSNWRYAFIVEGLLTLALLAVWIPFMSETPQDAKWLSKEERDYIVNTISSERALTAKQEKQNITLGQIFSIANIWKLIGIYFCYQVGIYGFSMWLPTLLKELTHSGIAGVGWLSTIPYIGTIIGLFVFGNLSDKSGNRKLYVSIPLIGFAICFMLATAMKSNIWLSFAFLTGCGVFLQSASSVFWTIPPLLFTGEVCGASRGIIGGLGNLGGFLGPYIVGWFITTTGNSSAGIYILVVFLLAGFLITLMLPSVTVGKSSMVTIGKSSTVPSENAANMK
ncbi:MFS transporter [Neobacillus ginsengisoli]|uniref:MFS family permease n=1 Tax=Neobacillus ginsengisoli TaxID=904295 RepID=A0ABT9XUX7_9BACI|nr:MFS transporter [Neobacillus ginsengisoli]MDQ0199373.1 MFS family permease [Neobacillus ginsengisoli]